MENNNVNNGNNRNNFLLLIGGIVLITILAGIAYLVFARSRPSETAQTEQPVQPIALTPGTTDCGTANPVPPNTTAASEEFLCLAEAAKTCGPAILRIANAADDLTLYRLENRTDGQCSVFVHTQVAREPQGSCAIDSPQLINTLIAWAWGRAGDADLQKGGKCIGSYFEMPEE